MRTILQAILFYFLPKCYPFWKTQHLKYVFIVVFSCYFTLVDTVDFETGDTVKFSHIVAKVSLVIVVDVVVKVYFSGSCSWESSAWGEVDGGVAGVNGFTLSNFE